MRRGDSPKESKLGLSWNTGLLLFSFYLFFPILVSLGGFKRELVKFMGHKAINDYYTWKPHIASISRDRGTNCRQGLMSCFGLFIDIWLAIVWAEY